MPCPYNARGAWLQLKAPPPASESSCRQFLDKVSTTGYKGFRLAGRCVAARRKPRKGGLGPIIVGHEGLTMRMLDQDRKAALRNVGLYLTVEEAKCLRHELEGLLKEPEANDHFHVYSLDNSGRELSCSLVTPEKLKNLGRYTAVEQDVLKEK